MSVDFSPNEEIPALAARLTPEMVEALKAVHLDEVIENKVGLPPRLGANLRQLAALGLVYSGYPGEDPSAPSAWIRNDNGQRVLGYLTGIYSGPYDELPSVELARWLEEQGPTHWWSLEGEPFLSGQLTLSCSGDLLARELRQANRLLLLKAPLDETEAKGQAIDLARLTEIAQRPEFILPRRNERILDLCWKGSIIEWVLVEDAVAARMFGEEETENATAAPLESGR